MWDMVVLKLKAVNLCLIWLVTVRLYSYQITAFTACICQSSSIWILPAIHYSKRFIIPKGFYHVCITENSMHVNQKILHTADI